MSEYILRIAGSAPPNMEPDISTDYIDANPFGYKRKDQNHSWSKGENNFSMCGEPPGLIVYFSGMKKEEETKILNYLIKGMKEKIETFQVS